MVSDVLNVMSILGISQPENIFTSHIADLFCRRIKMEKNFIEYGTPVYQIAYFICKLYKTALR